MPSKSVKRVNEIEETIQTAEDSGGSEVCVGDYVTIRFKVTRIRPVSHPHTGLEHRQDLELGRPISLDNGGEYADHFLVCDSRMCTKSE